MALASTDTRIAANNPPGAEALYVSTPESPMWFFLFAQAVARILIPAVIVMAALPGLYRAFSTAVLLPFLLVIVLGAKAARPVLQMIDNLWAVRGEIPAIVPDDALFVFPDHFATRSGKILSFREVAAVEVYKLYAIPSQRIKPWKKDLILAIKGARGEKWVFYCASQQSIQELPAQPGTAEGVIALLESLGFLKGGSPGAIPEVRTFATPVA